MNPCLPIPNDDDRCQCSLGCEEPLPGGAFVLKGNILGCEAAVTLREDCPHHGLAIALVRRGLAGEFGIGVHFPPAVRGV